MDTGHCLSKRFRAADGSVGYRASTTAPFLVQAGEARSTKSPAMSSGVRSVMGSSPGKAAARIRVRIGPGDSRRSEEHTSELQSLMRISYAVFCLKKKTQDNNRQ